MNRILSAAMLALAVTGANASDYTFSWSLPHPQGNALNAVVFEADDLHGYAVGAHGAVVATTDGGVSWGVQGELGAFALDLEDVMLMAPGELLAVGQLPGIFRSEDGGATWTSVTNPATGTLRDIARVAGGNLCAVGDAGQLLRSTDDGVTWAVGASPKSEDLTDQLWLNANLGYVVGFECCRRTTNGGMTWSTLPGVSEGSVETFNEVFATDASHVTVLADFHTARTSNGGATWSYEFVPNDLVYQATTVLLSPQHRLVARLLEGADILETTDDGESWNTILGDPEAQGLRDFIQLGDGNLIAISSEGDLWRSTDVGASWTNATHSPDNEDRVTISTFALAPNGHAFAGSTQPGQQIRRFHKSLDGGDNWVETPEPAINFMNTLGLIGGNVLLAGGGGASGQSRMWRSSDEGATWTFHSLPNSFQNGVQATDVEVVSASTAFVGTFGSNGSAIFWSTDAGLNWAQRTTGIPSTASAWGVDFVDTQLGFAGGGSSNLPRMFKTTNAGANWTAVGTSGIGDFIYDTHWFDAQTGLATNYSQAPGIYRTTNGGASWAQVSNARARRLSFADSQRGYCSVMNVFPEKFVLETTDAGATWTPVALPSAHEVETVFALPDGFLVGGQRSTILRGRLDTPADVAFGTSGLPVAATLEVRGSVGSQPELLFSLPARGLATLSVFDVRGRRVRTLAAGEFDGGARVSRVWDGADAQGLVAPEGIYFAQLRSGSQVVAAKLVLRR